MEKIVEFTKAFDRRHPDDDKNYGIHGVELRMVLKGTLGAVQFVLYTNWHLHDVQKEIDNKNNLLLIKPQPVNVGFHSPKPMHEDHMIMYDCPYLDGKPCYYDGSGLAANMAFDVLTSEGSDGLWKYLGEYYVSIFGELK